MKKLLCLSFILLSACGPKIMQNDPRTITGVDPVLKTYADMYMSYKGSGLDYDVPMQFADLTYPTVGLCTIWSNGYRQLQIDRTYWNNTDEDHRRQVVFHELGHCDLNRGHLATYIQSGPYMGWPTSIMNPYVFDMTTSMQSYYVTELFNSNHAMVGIGSAPDTDSDCVHHVEVE